MKKSSQSQKSRNWNVLFTLAFIAAVVVLVATKYSMSRTTSPIVPDNTNESLVACTMEAKICPDGSAVGRQGPNCEFAPCPGE